MGVGHNREVLKGVIPLHFTVSSAQVLHDAREYIRFGLDFFIRRKDHPYLLGLVTNDTCNLACRHCRVANQGQGNMPFQQNQRHLETFYASGARFLYLEGGESYLWRDGDRRLQDIIDFANGLGYLRVHLYTNGTFPLTAQPDFTWVSIDGLAESYRKIRGIPLENVLRNVRNCRQRWGITFVVNTINQYEIKPFLQFIQQEFPQIQVMFFFHTPYYGLDELLLSRKQKESAIAMLLACKDQRLPVLNSQAGLQAMWSGDYPHPTRLFWVVDIEGQYPCCRAFNQPEVCRECGYSTCAEIMLMRGLNPEALLTMLRSL